MHEMKNDYTLDEMLKQYALYQMNQDIQAGMTDEMKRKVER